MKKLFIVLIALIAILILSGVAYTYTSMVISVIQPGSMVTEASYIIFTDGTNYYARNGTTGKIDFSGTVALTAINYAINALKNGKNGMIYIKPGNYGTIEVWPQPGVDLWIEKGAIGISVKIPQQNYNGILYDMQNRDISMYKTNAQGNTTLTAKIDGTNSILQLGAYLGNAKLLLDRVAIKNDPLDSNFIDIQSENPDTYASVRIMPKGTPTGNTNRAILQLFETDYEADPDNYSCLEITSEQINGTPTFHINSFHNGTGKTRPIDFRIDGEKVLSILTNGDINISKAGRGILLTNADGTVTKRARLNDAGTDWVFEPQ